MAFAVRVVEVLGFSGLIRRRLLHHHDALADGCELELEIDRLLLAKSGGHGVVLLRFKAVRLGFHRVHAGLELRKAEPPGVVRFDGSLEAVLDVRGGHRGAGNRGPRGIGDRADDGAGGLALSQGRNARPERAGQKDQDCNGRTQRSNLGIPKL